MIRYIHSTPEAEYTYPSLSQYQSDGVIKINDNFKKNINSLINYSVGSGKTRIACNIIKEHIGKSYILVLCPSNEVINSAWIPELRNFNINAKLLNSTVLNKLKDTSELEFINSPKYNVYLMTYDLLITKDKITQQQNSVFFENNPPSLIVFDEFHNISNNYLNNKREINQNKVKSNTVLHMIAKHKLGLTGTPIVNSNVELEAAFLLLNYEPTNCPRYNSRFLISYNKNKLISTDYLIFYQPNTKEMTHILDKQYESEYIFARQMKATRGTLISLTNKTTKEKLIETIINNTDKNDKILIFEGQIECLYVMEQYECIKTNFPTVIHGHGMTKEERQRKIDSFKNSNSRILLSTKKLSSEGLNLQIANNLIICGLSWTYKEIEQCIGRINRTGQKKIPHTFILSEIISNPFPNTNTIPFKELIEKYNTLDTPLKYFPEYTNNYITALIKKSKIFQYNHQKMFDPNTIFINETNFKTLSSTIAENNKTCSKLINGRINKKEKILNILTILKNDDYLKLFFFLNDDNITCIQNRLEPFYQLIKLIKPEEFYKEDSTLEKLLNYSYKVLLSNLHLYLHYMNINFFYKDLIEIKYEGSEIHSNFIEPLSELMHKIKNYTNTLNEDYDYIDSNYCSIYNKYLTITNTLCNLKDLYDFPTKEELQNLIESNKEKAKNLSFLSSVLFKQLDIDILPIVVVDSSTIHYTPFCMPFDSLISDITETIAKLIY